MSGSSWVFDVPESQFEEAVLRRSFERPVVVDFWAPWCGPCRMLGPLLERLITERKGEVLLAKINTDEAQNLAFEFQVDAIPAVKAFRNGQPVLEFTGLLPEAHLRDFLDRLVPSAADRLASQAASLEATDAAEAERLYREALESQHDHEASVVGLARLLLARGATDEAAELLERIGPGTTLKEEVDRLEGTLALRQLGRDRGDEATLRQRVDREPDNAAARYELGCVLAASGKYPEALAMLLSAAERDRDLARSQVKEAMVQVFHAIGVRSPLADEYRDKLTRLLY